MNDILAGIVRDAHTIIRESIESALPDTAVVHALESEELGGRVIVIAIGKAAWRMANTAVSLLGDRLHKGLVITKYGHAEAGIDGFEIIEAGHPIPDENSIRAARRAVELVSGLSEMDDVLLLISGGGSSLFELPLPGVTLEDAREITQQLMICGADISEINTIRKRLSSVKAGRFGSMCAPARVLSIILSDVLGDAPDVIASGPAVPDLSTSGDALAILSKYELNAPGHVREALRHETPKSLANARAVIAGNVAHLCEAASSTAARLGYSVLTLTTALGCEAREAGAFLAAIAREIIRTGRPMKTPCAILLGGETVVHVRGTGKGGRNQELALAAAKGIEGLPNTLIFSVGSDGTDGPTDAGGGMVTGDFVSECRAAGYSIDDYLRNNDSYTLLNALGGLIKTGPTGTNVNDLAGILIR